jgi:hypothetical protein
LTLEFEDGTTHAEFSFRFVAVQKIMAGDDAAGADLCIGSP